MLFSWILPQPWKLFPRNFFRDKQLVQLCNQIDCFTRVVTWYVVVQALCSKMQGSQPNCSWTVVFFIVIILPLLQPVEKSLKVMHSEKEETMKNQLYSLLWPDHSSACSSVPQGIIAFSFAILKMITFCAEERSWLVSHSQSLFSCGPHRPQEKGLRLRSGHTRLEEPQLKSWIATQNIPCCKDWISKV